MDTSNNPVIKQALLDEYYKLMKIEGKKINHTTAMVELLCVDIRDIYGFDEPYGRDILMEFAYNPGGPWVSVEDVPREIWEKLIKRITEENIKQRQAEQLGEENYKKSRLAKIVEELRKYK